MFECSRRITSLQETSQEYEKDAWERWEVLPDFMKFVGNLFFAHVGFKYSISIRTVATSKKIMRLVVPWVCIQIPYELLSREFRACPGICAPQQMAYV